MKDAGGGTVSTAVESGFNLGTVSESGTTADGPVDWSIDGITDAMLDLLPEGWEIEIDIPVSVSDNQNPAYPTATPTAPRQR